MKKHALAVALTGALGAVVANAATVSEFANGVLVPFAVHGGDVGDTTAVGLTSCAAGNVYWTFFDPNTKHVTDGVFPMTADDQFAYIWSEESGVGLEDKPGYLVFILDTFTSGAGAGALDSSDAPCLAGAAFQVDTASNDVAYLPALPLDARPDGLFGNDDGGDFGPASSGIFIDDLTNVDQNDVVGLNAGANANDVLYMRYFIDNEEGGDDTTILVWSSQDLSGTYTVNIFDSDQNRKSVNFVLPNAELNIINPEEIVGRPADFLDGFIRWELPAAAGDEEGDPPLDGENGSGNTDEVRGVYAWSVIESPTFGAVQTIPALIQMRSGVGSALIPSFRLRVYEDADGDLVIDPDTQD